MKIQIVAKCNDMCSLHAYDGNNTSLQKQGYVPRGLGIGGGDYIRLTIDAETGKIEGWKPLTKDQIFDIME